MVFSCGEVDVYMREICAPVSKQVYTAECNISLIATCCTMIHPI